MRLLFSFLAFALISASAFAETETVQFSKGNDINIQQLSGSVIYYCRDNLGKNYSRHWYCDADLVSPGTHDYLVSNTPIDADKVVLTATREDGSTRSKDSKFDSTKSASSSRFNLLIKTLTQRPLLQVGTNQVAYTFTKGKQVVSEGSFQSKVTVVGKAQCKHRSTFTNIEDYCKFQNMGCDNYFYLENNCQY